MQMKWHRKFDSHDDDGDDDDQDDDEGTFGRQFNETWAHPVLFGRRSERAALPPFHYVELHSLSAFPLTFPPFESIFRYFPAEF